VESINTSPEPVLDGAKIVAGVVGVVGGVATVLVLVGVLSADQVPGLVGAATTAATGIVTLVGVVLPLWQARKVRAVVTPTIDPRTDAGVPLVPATQAETGLAPSGAYADAANPLTDSHGVTYGAVTDVPAGPDYVGEHRDGIDGPGI